MKPVLARYRGKVSRLYFRADAGFANPEVYGYLEGEGIRYAIRLPANRVLRERIGYLLKRSVNRQPAGDLRTVVREGKGAIRWTRLSCRSFAANAVRLQLHALAYNFGNFLRTLATPEPIKDWSLTSLKEKLIKIGAKVVSHGRYIAFQMGDVAIPRNLFADILRLIAELWPPPATRRSVSRVRQKPRERRLDDRNLAANRLATESR